MLIIKWEVMAHFTAKLITTLKTVFCSYDFVEKKVFHTHKTQTHTQNIDAVAHLPASLYAANASCVDVEFYIICKYLTMVC